MSKYKELRSKMWKCVQQVNHIKFKGCNKLENAVLRRMCIKIKKAISETYTEYKTRPWESKEVDK